MFDEKILREKARDAVESGKLPAQPAERTWAGKGSGVSCVVCDLPLMPTEVEFELDFSPAEGLHASRSCRVHAHCLAAWEFERRRMSRR